MEQEEGIKEKKYIHFKLGIREFIMDISVMEEVIDLGEIIQIPDVPDFIEGVARFRTQVIPVLNIKDKLDIQETEHDERAKIMIVKYKDENLGIIIDKLIGVTDLQTLQTGKFGLPDILRLDKILTDDCCR